MLKLGFSPFLWRGMVDIFLCARRDIWEPFYRVFFKKERRVSIKTRKKERIVAFLSKREYLLVVTF